MALVHLDFIWGERGEKGSKGGGGRGKDQPCPTAKEQFKKSRVRSVYPPSGAQSSGETEQLTLFVSFVFGIIRVLHMSCPCHT